MLFNSLHYLFFLPVTVFLYYALPHRWQNRMLLAASYVFYGAWDPDQGITPLVSGGLSQTVDELRDGGA